MRPIGINSFSVTDPAWANVTLLMHCDGANGAQTYTDSGPYNRAFSVVGSPPLLTTGNKKFGTAALNFNTTGSISSPNDLLDYFGAGDFTVEAWVYPTNGGVGPFTVISRWASSGLPNANQFILYVDTLTPVFGVSVDGNAAITATGPVLTLNQWNHVAAVRSGSTIKVYTNGVAGASQAVSGSLFSDTNNTLLIGSFNGGGSGKFTGSLDDLRITRGVARYTANFAPPTAEFPSSSGSPPVRPIAVGDTSGVIPVSSNGAQVGDLVLVYCHYGAGTPSGAGWTTVNFNYGYAASYSWKVLDNLTNITVSGFSQSFMYAIYRGPKVAARVYFGIVDGTTTPPMSVTWPTPDPKARAQMMFMHAQAGSYVGPAAGFADRMAVSDGIFFLNIHDRLTGAVAGVSTMTGGLAANSGFELRDA
jgi:hypothetical protein